MVTKAVPNSRRPAAVRPDSANRTLLPPHDRVSVRSAGKDSVYLMQDVVRELCGPLSQPLRSVGYPAYLDSTYSGYSMLKV